jgi:hypothetical protein
VILSVLMCDIWINVLLQTSALVGPLYIVNWNARWNSEINIVFLFTTLCNYHNKLHKYKFPAETKYTLLKIWHKTWCLLHKIFLHSCCKMNTTKTSDLNFLIHHPESTRKNWLPSTLVIFILLQLISVIHKIHHILLYILRYFVFVWNFTRVFEDKNMLQRKRIGKNSPKCTSESMKWFTK